MKKTLLLASALLSSAVAMAQWSGDRNIATTIFASDMNLYWNEPCLGADGTLWFLGDNPSSIEVEDLAIASYAWRLQGIRPDGTRVFGDEGMLISNYDCTSWTVCGQLLHANADSTLTVVIRDCRNHGNHNTNYTAYRLRPDGTHVWDEDGVPVDNAMEDGNNAAMSITELEDGSNVFAWLWSGDNTTNVSLQRITLEGEPQWNPLESKLAGSFNDYPYLVRSTGNRFILVWGRTSSEYLTAMAYNADGSEAWSKRVTLYTGGFGSSPAWTKIKVKSSGDGGAIVTWYDDRDASNIEFPYIAYVKEDGQLGYVNADGKADIRIGYEEWRHLQTDVIPDGQGTGFLAIFNQSDINQNWYNACLQHISLEGDLDYGETGKELMPIDDVHKSVYYISVQPGPDGTFAAFWMEHHESYWDIQCHMTIRRISDGEPVSEDTRDIRFVEGGRYRSGLKSFVDWEHECWYTYWQDQGATPDDKRNLDCVQRIGFDGSLPAIDNLTGIQLPGAATYFDLQGHALTTEPATGIYIKRQGARSQVINKL